ncbi:mitochondrial protein Pet127-domain-containing protein [Melampsora americana]|nr:mitochondrial protein Pet127-domain-containing protein [Melampsora americana]
MLACTRRSNLPSIILASASQRPPAYIHRQSVNHLAGVIPTDSDHKFISHRAPVTKTKATSVRSKPRSPQQSNLRKLVKEINAQCTLTASQKKLDLTAIFQIAKENVGRLTGRESTEKRLKIKLKIAEETLKLLKESPTPGKLNPKVQKKSKQPASAITDAQPPLPAEPSKQASSSNSNSKQTSTSKQKASRLKPNPHVEATLETDILAAHPLFDPSQAPEPSNSHVTKPDAVFSFSYTSIPFEPVIPSTSQPKVATLAHGLSRVLFNPGVHWLQDPRTMVYNFDHRLQDLITPDEFNFDALTPYITSSRDQQLTSLAHENERKYCGSTSSMTQTLSQIYLMLNGSRPLNVGMLTSNKKVELTPGAKMPASILLNYNAQTGKYSIDSDKSFEPDTECPDSTILSTLGHVLEKFFVLPHDKFSQLLKKNKDSVDLDETRVREAYAFGKTNLMVTRSQLDCQHDYLPGNGTFDIKTRATIAIRHDRLNHANAAGYQIRSSQGPLESFEREYLDLIRSAFLKYQFQARLGQMDGVFVAYHNTQRVFGFEYVPITKMDDALFGSHEEGDKVFKICLGYMERILEDATTAYPERSLRITTFAKGQNKLWVFVHPAVEPVTLEPPKEYTAFQYQNHNYLNGDIVEDGYIDIDAWCQANKVKTDFTPNANDTRNSTTTTGTTSSASEFRRKLDWSVYCQMWKHSKSEELDALYRSIRRNQFAISQLVLPEGVDRQLMRVVNWPETANEQIQENGDDLTVKTEETTPDVRPHTFVPTPGVKYKTEVSYLVKQLRSMAKEGWAFQRELIESQAGQKVISIAPVEFVIEDRELNANHTRKPGCVASEELQNQREKAIKILTKGEERLKARNS